MARRKERLIGFTEAERVHVQQAAEAKGMSFAGFCRAAALTSAGPMPVERRPPAQGRVTQDGGAQLPLVRR